MTISTTGNSQVFLGNGATTVFTFTFVGGETAWIKVIYTAADGTQTDVTASCAIALNAPTGGALWGVGGTVTYNPSGSPIASGTSLTVTRTIPLTQLTAFANQNSVYNTVTEESFDTLVMQLQQINTTLLTSFQATSTTSLTIGTGTQSLTIQTGKGFAPGSFITIAYQTTPTNFMQGVVTSYTSNTGALVVNVTDTLGSGTYASWFIALSGAPEATAITLTGDVTGSGTTSIATTIAANAVTNAKFRQGVARSVVGVTGNATANIADIQGAANQALVVNSAGTALSFGALNLASSAAVTGALAATSFPALTGDVTTVAGALATTIAANAVTNAKAAQMAAYTIKGNATGSTANATDVAAGTAVTLWGIPTNQNIIQNGDFLVDQANEGASVTVTSGSGLFRSADRWLIQFAASTSGAGNPTIQQGSASAGLPAGVNLTKSLLITANVTPGTTSPAALRFGLQQTVEGSDIVDLGLGTAGASTVTLSFYAKTSIANFAFAAALENSGNNRAYPAVLTTGTANTWALYSATVTLDVTGTWLNGAGQAGLKFIITLAGGSNFQGTGNAWNASTALTTSAQTQFTNTGSATFEITGVRFERGSTATPFWSTPYAENINKLRRYYKKTFPVGTAPAQSGGVAGALTVQNPIALGQPSIYVPFDPPMYASPTVVTYNPSAGNANWRDITAAGDIAVSVDPASTKSTTGVQIGTGGTITNIADNIAIHATFDSGI